MVWVSCEEYGIQEINRLGIDQDSISISGIEEHYEKILGDQLTIEPQVSQSGNSDLSYLWITRLIFDVNNSIVDTLSYEKNLNYTISLLPQSLTYQLEFYVIDNTTQVFKRNVAGLNVSTDYAHGILLLNESNSAAKLDYIRFDGKHYDDVFSSINGEVLGQNALSVKFNPTGDTYIPSFIQVTCADSRGGVMLNPFSMTKIHDTKDLFGFPPSNIESIQSYSTVQESQISQISYQWFYFNNYSKGNAWGQGSYILADNKVYTIVYDRFADINTKFGYPQSKAEDDTPEFDLYHKGFSYTPGSAIYFDKLNKRFLEFHAPNSSNSTPGVFHVGKHTLTDLNFDIINAGWGSTKGSSGNNACFLVKNENDEFELFVLKMGYSTTNIFREVLTGTLTNFTEETPVAFSHYFHGFYYADESNNLVFYNAEDHTNTNLGNLGNQITALKLKALPQRDDFSKMDSYYLYVATYGGSDGTGSVYVYNVNTEDNKNITLLESYENVSDHIIDVDYKMF